MLRTLIICPGPGLSRRLQQSLEETGCVTAVRIVPGYPDEIHLSRVLRAHGPHVVFLGIQSLDYCTTAAAHIESIMPDLQVVAFGGECDANVLMAVMHTGIREFLALPFEESTVQACLSRVAANLRARPMAMPVTRNLFSFLPSKPGAGTSTLAVNVAAAMASTGTHTLLADFDLNSGMIRFMLKASTEYSVLDALQSAAKMDKQLWSQIVNKRENLDVLHSGRINPDLRVEKVQIQHLLGFARRNYGAIFADLSGNLERYSIELMHESKKIFVVCTPEVASVHLAREKIQYLHQLDLTERTVILLNRQTRRAGMDTKEIESLVGVPVCSIFPNDYTSVTRSISDGVPVPPTTELGKQCVALAQTLLEKKVESATEKRRFVEYFSIVPRRFSLDGPGA